MASSGAEAATSGGGGGQLLHRYDWHKRFDPSAYVRQWYSLSDDNDHAAASHVLDERTEDGDSQHPLGFTMRMMHQYLSEIERGAGVVLDIGTGPSIVPVVLMAGALDYNGVVCSDFTPSCRMLLQVWWWGQDEPFSWEAFFRYACRLTGRFDEDDWILLAELTRKTIQANFSSDLEQLNIMAPHDMDPFDVVTSAGAFECAAADLDAFESMLESVNRLVSVGGHLLFTGTLGRSFLMASTDSDCRFQVLPLSEASIRSALRLASFEVLDFSAVPLDKDAPLYGELYDGELTFACKARKLADIAAYEDYDQDSQEG